MLTPNVKPDYRFLLKTFEFGVKRISEHTAVTDSVKLAIYTFTHRRGSSGPVRTLIHGQMVTTS